MKHIDSHLHVRGESQYVDDVPPPPDLLHAAVFGSPRAHGIITPGWPPARRALPPVWWPCSPRTTFRASTASVPSSRTSSCWWSARCASSATRSRWSWRAPPTRRGRARELIEVEIDELPVVVDPREAFANGDLIHPPRTMAAGDVSTAWDNCDVVVVGRCEIGGQEHLYLETQRARAIPTEDGAMRVFSSTQGPAAVQHVTAEVLGLPMHKVEVDVKRLGGGFGGKEDQATHWAAMAALAAAHMEAPVELVLNRLDDIRMTGKRHPYSADFRIGLTADARILAYEATFYQNSGAFADLSPPVLARTLFHGTNAYYIPNVKLTAAPCRTNLQPHTAFRGFGGPAGDVRDRGRDQQGGRRDGDRGGPRSSAPTCCATATCSTMGRWWSGAAPEPTWAELVAAFGVDRIRQRVAEFNREQLRRQERAVALMPVCFGISFTKSHLNQGQRPGPRLRRRQRERDHRRHRDGPGHQQQRRGGGGAHLRHRPAPGARREHQYHARRQHVAERGQRHHRPERQRGDHRRRDHPRGHAQGGGQGTGGGGPGHGDHRR